MPKIGRREFIAGSIGAAAASRSLAQAPLRSGTRPNILFILADDLGWGDLSCYGRPDYQTPNIDLLAQQGMRFTNAYSAAPVCTPTRVGFHTGRYPARLQIGLEEPIQARKAIAERVNTLGIPHEHPTVASILKSVGYETALIGKWHVGYLPNFGPLRYGYDEFFGIMSGAGDYFTHKDPAGDPDLFEGEVPVERVGYTTDILTDRAIEYVKRRHAAPFYLSLHYTAPHWPWEGPGDVTVSKALKNGYEGFTAGGSLKIYAAMMRSLDAAVGRVLSALKAERLENNTLVIFTSDNGGERFSFNWPFRGEKFDVYEGGVRVPAIVRWPGVTRPRSVSDQTVITMDWTASMIAAAGARPDPNYPLDGEDVTEVLRSQRPLFDRTFYWRTFKQGGMRSGKWKYIREEKSDFLYDLSADEREQADRAGAQLQTLAEMRAKFDSWASGMQQYPKK
jgi:arylsulfatase A-like enzyme